ncbi:MAG: acetyl-CoA carboxylase biotin carboxyl carrier protein [Chthoniobacterales bacterium]|jgi:acetyl-CoA carboxylase biotin carboxyl carrier protein
MKKETNVDLKEIKALIDLMQKNGLTAFELEKDGFRISLAKEAAYQSGMAYAAPAPAAAPAAAAPSGKEIASPMVGTFYSAASPEAPAFITVGQKVTPDTVVCIIEAMKVMNEIKAEVAGTITEIAAENGQPVQFGQALFRYK